MLKVILTLFILGISSICYAENDVDFYMSYNVQNILYEINSNDSSEKNIVGFTTIIEVNIFSANITKNYLFKNFEKLYGCRIKDIVYLDTHGKATKVYIKCKSVN